MRRLYLRIYAAVLASLVAFALVAGLLWRLLGDGGPGGHAFEVAGGSRRTCCRRPTRRPPCSRPPCERLARGSARRRRPLRRRPESARQCRRTGPRPRPGPRARRLDAGCGAARPAWSTCATAGGWSRACGPSTAPRARPSSSRSPSSRRPSASAPFRWCAASPRRLERLQAGVESLGAGRSLGARARRRPRRGRPPRARASTAPPRASRSWSPPTRRSSPTPRTSCAPRSPASAWRSSCRGTASSRSAGSSSSATSPSSTR